jgi:hypothetical protein
MHLTLAEWDEQVGHHLQMIEAGAEICERHATRLLGTPDFETRAADDLARATATLARALARVVAARRLMEGKPHVG